MYSFCSNYYWNMYLNFGDDKLQAFATEKLQKNVALLHKTFHAQYKTNLFRMNFLLIEESD